MRSIKAKVLLLIVGIMAVTAAVFIFFTKQYVGNTMLEAEQKSVRNAMFLIKLNVENEYKSLLFHKMTTLTQRKNEMKDLSTVIQSGLENLYRLTDDGILAGEDAKARALDWVSGLEHKKDRTFFIYSEDLTILSHPNRNFIGTQLPGLTDVKGQPLLRSMMEKVKREGGGFASFSWDDAEGGTEAGARKLGYFSYVPGWKWVIGTAVSIEDIEREAQRKLNLIVEELRQTFARTKLAQTGYFFLFNGRKELLVHPTLAGNALQDIKNASSGNILVDDLIAAARTPDKPIEYLWQDSSAERGGPSLYESYVDYFKTLDWYIVSSIRKDEIELPAKDLVMRQTLFIAAIFAASLLIAYLLVSQLSKHLGKLAAYAKEIPSHDFSSTAVEPSSIEPLARKYRDEVGRLAEAFLFMEHELKQYIHDLRETTAAKERIESELEIARDIQMSFLPKIFPPFPERKEFEIYAMVKPAREVGGDFYDFFFVDEDHLFFSLGDVSGKGVPASLFMAVTKTLLRASAGVGVDPDHVMASVNNRLCDGNDACMFVTVICGILNVRTGEVVCADGGHNPSLYVSLPDEVKFLDLPRAMALGVMEETHYKMERLVLKPGETIFMYTDGITEAMNVCAEMYSDDRLLNCVYRMKGLSVKEICDGLMESIDDFSRGAPQADDITMLAIRYRGDS